MKLCPLLRAAAVLSIGFWLASCGGGTSMPQQAPNNASLGSPQSQPLSAARHVRYSFIDLGTLGGPASFFANGFDGVLSPDGTSTGFAETPGADPFSPFCIDFDCFVPHTFTSRNGTLTDRGALPGAPGSQPAWISMNGIVAGLSEDGHTLPMGGGFPEFRAVIWNNGGIVNLGTAEGGTFSVANAVNNSSDAAGLILNNTPDAFSLFAPGLAPGQTRAFLWKNGVGRDLGTLGGNDAQAFLINASDEVVGQSYTNVTPNASTGIPTVDPFIWKNGKMSDIGTLGGTMGFPKGLNDRGDVIGTSNLAGDTVAHAFVWTQGTIKDLGTLGGPSADVNWINDQSEIAGKADLSGPAPQNHDAVLWRQGQPIDLGKLPGDSCSNAYYVNDREQVVGTSEDRTLCLIPAGEHAFIWERGSHMVDLNTLIPAGADLQLTFAFAINNQGVIVGEGRPTGCAQIVFCGRAYVLIPCNSGAACEVRNFSSTRSLAKGRAEMNEPAPLLSSDGPISSVDRLRAQLTHQTRLHGPGLP